MKHICQCSGHEATLEQLENDLVRVKKKPTPYETGLFEEFRSKYRGKKRGLETELDNFTKHKDWRNILPKLVKLKLNFDVTESKYIPHLQTFINQRRWEMMEQDEVEPPHPYGNEHDWRTNA